MGLNQNHPLATAIIERTPDNPSVATEIRQLRFEIHPVPDVGIGIWANRATNNLLTQMQQPSVFGEFMRRIGPEGVLIDLASGCRQSAVENLAKQARTQGYLGIDPSADASWSEGEVKYVKDDMLHALTTLAPNSASIVTMFGLDLRMYWTEKTANYLEALGTVLRKVIIPNGILILDPISIESSGFKPERFGFAGEKSIYSGPEAISRKFD